MKIIKENEWKSFRVAGNGHCYQVLEIHNQKIQFDNQRLKMRSNNLGTTPKITIMNDSKPKVEHALNKRHDKRNGKEQRNHKFALTFKLETVFIYETV